MKKNVLKYLIDVMLFIDMCAIAVIGLLLGFVIPKGASLNRKNFSLDFIAMNGATFTYIFRFYCYFFYFFIFG